MTNNNCIFCGITAGRIPSCKVYEDEHTLAFIDIGPIVKGHTLVIPKTHYDPIMETPDDVLGQLVAVVRKIARAQMKALHADGVNVFQTNGKAAGQEVPHIHFHVIPRFNNDNHRWNWKPGKYEQQDEMSKMAETIAAEV